MIRPLAPADLPATFVLLRQVAAQNLYMLGNLETLGLGDGDPLGLTQFWGDFRVVEGGGRLQAVLNRYMNGWALYGLPTADWAGLAAIIDSHPIAAARLQDNPGGIDSLLPFLQRYVCKTLDVEELMALAAPDFVPASLHQAQLRRATLADLPRLIEFYADAGDMTRTPTGVERPLRDTRLWLAEENGLIVSAALCNAETSDLAMVGGVFTPPTQRGRGLSQSVVSALCADLLASHKQPVLYWKNPVAGAIYHKLGFHPIGACRAVHLASSDQLKSGPHAPPFISKLNSHDSHIYQMVA